MLQRGFSLIEMMVAVAILAILATLAAPSFTALIVNNRIVTETNALVGDLAYARSEALRRGGVVSVCLSSGGVACESGTDWSVGRLVFSDGGGTRGTLESGETKLRQVGAVQQGITITAGGTFSGSAYVSYLSSGFVAATGTFTVCSTGYSGRVITLSATGRATVSTTNC